jgi:hypothetical protein
VIHKNRKAHMIMYGKLEVGDHLEDLSINGKAIVKRVSEKYW